MKDFESTEATSVTLYLKGCA